MIRSSTSLKLAVTAGAVTNLVGAAIISADFSASPLTITNNGARIYVDFETATASTSILSGHDGFLFFFQGLSEVPSFPNDSPNWLISNSAGYSPYKFSFGDLIGASVSAAYNFLEALDTGFWAFPNDGAGYLGFNHSGNGNQAWLFINYDDAANTITLLGMGYNDSGTLTAGETSPIPEPAAATALAALLAGGVAAFQRRRRAA